MSISVNPRRIIILTVPPVHELDLVGIVQVFATANDVVPQENRYKVEVITLESVKKSGVDVGDHRAYSA